MKFNGIDSKLQNEIIESLKTSENKPEAIMEAIEKLTVASHENMISELMAANEQIRADENAAKRLGYRTSFSTSEKKFYESLCAKQAITADQIDIIPNEIIDRTLADIREQSATLKLVTFAPAGVKKWLTGSYTGTAAWTTLTAALDASKDLQATIAGLDIEAFKMYAILIIPKAIRDLALPLVDKYFTAVLNEVMHDGAVDGFLNGNGTSAPIGIDHKLPTSAGTISAKTVVETVTGFDSESIAPHLVTLSKNGKRAVNKLYVVANPVDVYNYVNKSLRYFNGMQYVSVAPLEVEVIEEPACTQGKAFLTIEGHYTMGFGGIKVDEYKEAKAIDDANLLISKVYGNGRADDDNTAIVFDPSKLTKFVPEYKSVS